MSDIQKTNTGLAIIDSLNSLPATVKEVTDALESPLVSAVLPGDIFHAVKIGAEKSYQDTGFKIPSGPEELKYIIMEVMEYIKKRYPSIRLREIPVAFARGIRKQYGEYMGLSVISFCLFIDGYMKDVDQSRKNALVASIKTEAPEIPGYDEMFELAKNNAIRALRDTEIGKDISLYSSPVYVFLERLKLIDLTDEEIKEYHQTARELLVEEYQARVDGKLSYDKHKRKANKTILDVLISGEKSKDAKAQIVLKSKFLAVSDYMKSVLMDELDLGALIESKKSEFTQEELFG